MHEPRPIPAHCPFWDRRVTLATVVDNALLYSHDVAGKVEVLEELARGARGLCFAAWTGQHTTDLFLVTGEDATRLLAERADRLKSSKFPR